MQPNWRFNLLRKLCVFARLFFLLVLMAFSSKQLSTVDNLSAAVVVAEVVSTAKRQQLNQVVRCSCTFKWIWWFNSLLPLSNGHSFTFEKMQRLICQDKKMKWCWLHEKLCKTASDYYRIGCHEIFFFIRRCCLHLIIKKTAKTLTANTYMSTDTGAGFRALPVSTLFFYTHG